MWWACCFSKQWEQSAILAFPTFPSTSSFMITAGGSPSSFPCGSLDKCWKLVWVCWKAFDPHFGEHDADDGTIYLLVATTLLMKSAILMVTTDVVSSPAPQLSRIWPPIPFKVINWWLWWWLSLFTIKSPIVKFSTISHSKQTHTYIHKLGHFWSLKGKSLCWWSFQKSDVGVIIMFRKGLPF